MTTGSIEQGLVNAQHTETVAFDQINAPGSYVRVDTGNLFRVPEDSLAAGRSPCIEMVGKSAILMTRLSHDPWLPISKARQVAADLDLYVNF
jgi:hypothetical protein